MNKWYQKEHHEQDYTKRNFFGFSDTVRKTVSDAIDSYRTMIGYHVTALILAVHSVWMYPLLKSDCCMTGIRKHGAKKGSLQCVIFLSFTKKNTFIRLNHFNKSLAFGSCVEQKFDVAMALWNLWKSKVLLKSFYIFQHDSIILSIDIL